MVLARVRRSHMRGGGRSDNTPYGASESSLTMTISDRALWYMLALTTGLFGGSDEAGGRDVTRC